ncbi:helix-turn-helix transcriptional regulator [Siminovitchia sediminis]|uniref:Helix-turn-helix transcriptional regulator n=1 Tax=Siminovitchia sediminis TaxID=1274353 RepID=A0ABW4KMW3_9BACI
MNIKVNIVAFKEARVKKGFSQRELAKRAHLSHALISQIENNERNPSPGSAKKICDTLEVQFDDIFFAISVCKCKQPTA